LKKEKPEGPGSGGSGRGTGEAGTFAHGRGPGQQASERENSRVGRRHASIADHLVEKKETRTETFANQKQRFEKKYVEKQNVEKEKVNTLLSPCR
jgi:hypothetical protein